MSPELFQTAGKTGEALLTSLASAFGFDADDCSHVAAALDGSDMQLSDSSVTADDQPYRTVGRDPVGRAQGGQTAIQDAFAPRGEDPSKMDEAVERVADKDAMSQAERDAYRQAMAEAEVHPERMRQSTVGAEGLNGKKIVMANGPEIGDISAQRVVVDLPPDTPVQVGTYRYQDADGVWREETFYIINGCANPAVDAGEDTIIPPQPPVCEPGARDMKPEVLKGSTKHPEPITAAVVTTKVENIGDIWQDKDGDGDAWDSKETRDGVKYSIDKDEVNMDALPSEDQIEKDIAAYQAQHDGRKPEHLWYSFVDCNGRSIVLCYDIKNERWGILKDVEAASTGVLEHPVIDTKEELDVYLTKERVVPKQ